MKVNWYLPAPVRSPPEVRDRVAPSQPVARTLDPARDQSRASEQWAVSQQERQFATSWLAKDAHAAVREAHDPRARKALAAYESVASTPAREYVSRVLGFNDFA